VHQAAAAAVAEGLVIGTFIDRQVDLPLWAAARAGDKPTSKAAGLNARRRFARGHGRRILEALALGPATKDEIAARIGGLDQQQVARRMHELVARGMVLQVGEAVSPSGNRETVYSRA
jgi:hypothetical protein